MTNRFFGGNNSVVECDLAKVEVAGSNPVSRSTTPPRPIGRTCPVGLFFSARAKHRVHAHPLMLNAKKQTPPGKHTGGVSGSVNRGFGYLQQKPRPPRP